MECLELICSACREKIKIDLSEEEYHQRSLIEGSRAYHELFDSYGWVLRQAPFCAICKYEHSEVYK